MPEPDSYYSVDHVLHETGAIIEELKVQLEVETNKIHRLEANLADTAAYPTPAWFVQ